MTQNELIHKIVSIIVVEGQSDTKKFKLGETIRYSPSEIMTILEKHENDLIKHGRWIENNPLNATKCRLIQCSECGKGFIVGYNVAMEDWIEGHNRNYCGNCGADMRGTIDEKR